MKIVIAPDSWKESLSAQDVAAAIEAGFRDIFPHADYVTLPMADGGEGTVSAMVAATCGKIVPLRVTGPSGLPVDAFYGLSGDGHSAFIEMAAASGLALVPGSQRNPLTATSYGTGELIKHALAQGVSRCIIGIGGSATNDGGAGMAQALGVQLYDCQGNPLAGGDALTALAHIDTSRLDRRIAGCRFDVACDVTNRLTGEEGASAIFGPQKGATPDMVRQLDQALVHFAQIIRSDLNVDVLPLTGGGAAGGMGAGLYAFCQANLRPGVEIVSDALGLAAQIQDADLVITGEGRLDSQSRKGKVPIGVARLAKRWQRPVLAIAGSLSRDVDSLYAHGLDAVFSVISRPCTLDEALTETADNLRLAARNLAALYRLGGIRSSI